MKVHLIDGTFELFRAYYGAPPSETAEGFEVGAVRGLARSMLALLGEPGVTHVAIAFDHVIESFRNDLYQGYKTGDGIDPQLLPHVFEPFRKGHHSAAGLGLGLSIVRHLVSMHDGTVTAQSPGVGRGTSFLLTFPLVRASAGALPPRSRNLRASA
jgi:hypothetical protein